MQGFLVWLTVEITCNDGWHIRSYLFDFVQEESYTFLAGYLAVIVQVSVEIHKFLSVAFFLQYCPGGDTVIGSVPTFYSDGVGILAQREVPIFYKCKAVCLEEYRTIFTGFFSVITSHTECGVLGKPLFEIFHLVMAYFLHSQ